MSCQHDRFGRCDDVARRVVQQRIQIRDVIQQVVGAGCGMCGAAVAALVRRDEPVSLGGQRNGYLFPGHGVIQDAVQADDRRAVRRAPLGYAQPQAVRRH
jgi:hypothetical protein